ncbi:hypothetical protein Tco_0432164 [Tanacetum coccineum]
MKSRANRIVLKCQEGKTLGILEELVRIVQGCWIEKIEQVFEFASVPWKSNVIMFAASTFDGSVCVIWWNGNVHNPRARLNANPLFLRLNSRRFDDYRILPKQSKSKRMEAGNCQGYAAAPTKNRPGYAGNLQGATVATLTTMGNALQRVIR